MRGGLHNIHIQFTDQQQRTQHFDLPHKFPFKLRSDKSGVSGMMENNRLTKGDDCWISKSEGGETEKLLREGKASTVKEAAELLAHETASLKIHKLDGTIEEEWTFPRSALSPWERRLPPRRSARPVRCVRQ